MQKSKLTGRCTACGQGLWVYPHPREALTVHTQLEHLCYICKLDHMPGLAPPSLAQPKYIPKSAREIALCILQLAIESPRYAKPVHR